MHLRRAEAWPVFAAGRLHDDRDIDAVQKRFREAVFIPFYFQISTSAALALMVEVAAGTGVHRRYKHDIGWILDLGVDARYHYTPVLKRFAKGFEDVLWKMGELVKKEYPAMGQSDLAYLRVLRPACKFPRTVLQYMSS